VNERGWKLLISAVIIATIIAWVAGANTFVFYDDTRLGAFALICACIWIGIFNSIQSVCRERGIIKREYRTGLFISSYVSAHMLFQMALCFVQALLVTVIVAVFRDVPTSGVILPGVIELLITFFLVIYASAVLGLAISCIVKNETAAMTVMPFVLIIQLVMSGVVFSLEGGAEMISYFTISKWGVNAICTTANVVNMRDFFFAGVSRDTYEFVAANLFGMWFWLIIFTFLYSVIGIVSLKFVGRDKR
jgi:hypothetical protein